MRLFTTIGILVVIAVGTSLLVPGVSSAQDGDAAADADCSATCDCYREPPPLPPQAGEKGLPETDPAGKTDLEEELPES